MLHIGAYREPRERLSDHLPWFAMVAPGVLLQKDGTLLRSYRFRGPDLAASTTEEFISIAGRANNAFKRLGSGWSIFVEDAKRPVTPYPRSQWPTPASAIVDAERRRRFAEAGALLESQYHLSFVWGTPTERSKRAVSLFYEDESPVETNVSIDREIEHFDKATSEVADVLGLMFPEMHALDSDALLTYLKSTISCVEQPVRMPEFPMRLDAFLPDVRFCPGETPTLGDRYLSIFTIRGFPSSTFVGMLDHLGRLRFPYRWVTRFLCLDSADAEARILTTQKNWFSKQQTIRSHVTELFTNSRSAVLNPSADGKVAETRAALVELGNDTAAFGYCTATFVTWSADRRQVAAQARAMKKLLHSRGLVTIDESLNSLEAWCGTHPGNVHANVRRPLIHTQNLIHLLPLTASSSGDKVNQHLKKVTGVGAPHVYCSAGSSPYRLNLFVGDVGNTFIVGPVGSGKSTLLSTLALQWLRYPKARVIIYDRDRSARAATLANASVPGFVQYFEPGNPKAPLAFQPLRSIDDPGEFVWASEFIELLLELQGIAINDQLQSAIDQTLKQVAAEVNPARRTLTRFTYLFSSHTRAAADALRPYTKDGNYGQIFDGGGEAEGGGTYAPWRMYEMGTLMELGDKAVIPSIKYLDHRDSATYGQPSDAPLLKIYDECWRFMAHPTFRNILRRDLKTLRKKNVAIVFATQEVTDAAASKELLSTILSACQTQIYLADASALTPAVAAAYTSFGLAPHELGLLANAQPKRDYYYRSVRGRRLFSLDLGPAALALAGAASPTDQSDMDAIVADSTSENYASALFARRGVAWAVDAIKAGEVGAL
jgi:type IV secretion/conjugal transfer VirB4 family ATPase